MWINFSKTLAVYTSAFFCIILISYLAMHALPGDPILRLFADYAISENGPRYQRLQIMYGYQHGLWEGFWLYCNHLLHGEMGFSISYSAPVEQVIAEVLPWTWLLTLVTAPLALVFSYIIGIEAAMRHGSFFDAFILTINNLVNAVPSFVKAVVLFFIFLYFFPSLPLQGSQTAMSQYHGWQRLGDIALHLIAPVSVLFLTQVGKLLLPIRAGSLIVLSKPYVTAAQLRGISPWRLRHAYIGNNIRGILLVRGASLLIGLLSSSIFVETVFNYPGIGLALFQGIAYRDYALVQGVILLLSAHILLLHFIVDVGIELISQRG